MGYAKGQNVKVSALRKKFRPLEKPIADAARKMMNLTKENGVLEIYLVSDRLMRKNVLAYPAPKGFPKPDVKGKYLGEIYLNPDYIENKGEDIFFMLIHGFLHLLGYDHKRKADRIRMEKKEKELMSKL